MRTAYLDCFAGIAGDMFLGALVDAGVPHAVLEEATAALQVGASLRFETVDRSGITATKVHVLQGDALAESAAVISEAEQARPQSYSWQPQQQQQHGMGHAHPHGTLETPDFSAPTVQVGESAHAEGRSLQVIRQLIQDSAFAERVKHLALRAFELLGASEAKIHNVPLDEVHFHEVGSVDAIVDIVASAAGIVHLNVEAWFCSPMNVGGGFVRCAHGVFPVPAPATADLLRGAPTYSAHVQKELVTPTGAALLRALDPTFGQQPPMTVYRIGYGAGTRNPPDFPNVLRLSVGHGHGAPADPAVPASAQRDRTPDSRHSAEAVTVLETALDDATPQLLGYVTEQALQLGALDVMLTPVVMKKGRPGTLLTVLCNPEDAAKFEQMLLRETTTLGLRIRQDRRVCLQREHITVQTAYGSIRVKTGTLKGETLNAHPEFEDCRHAAEQHGVPLKQVQAAAIAAYVNQGKVVEP